MENYCIKIQQLPTHPEGLSPPLQAHHTQKNWPLLGDACGAESESGRLTRCACTGIARVGGARVEWRALSAWGSALSPGLSRVGAAAGCFEQRGNVWE
eukprot:scaffold8733_cov114-Isochrysis_galbana.AAC.9